MASHKVFIWYSTCLITQTPQWLKKGYGIMINIKYVKLMIHVDLKRVSTKHSATMSIQTLYIRYLNIVIIHNFKTKYHKYLKSKNLDIENSLTT